LRGQCREAATRSRIAVRPTPGEPTNEVFESARDRLRLEAYLPFKPEFATHLYLHEHLPSKEPTGCDLRDRLAYYFRSICLPTRFLSAWGWMALCTRIFVSEARTSLARMKFQHRRIPVLELGQTCERLPKGRFALYKRKLACTGGIAQMQTNCPQATLGDAAIFLDGWVAGERFWSSAHQAECSCNQSSLASYTSYDLPLMPLQLKPRLAVVNFKLTR
jgi:hypothetical protein